jgi:hypothetical protein
MSGNDANMLMELNNRHVSYEGELEKIKQMFLE